MDFFKEYEALQLTVPRVGGVRLNAVNSEYTFNTDQCKNCYLIANAVKNQDCMYGRDFYACEDCIDCDHVLHCTLCYQCLNCKGCYDSTQLQDSADCQNCDYGYYLKDCKNCIGCVGLRKKEFYIFNEPYSKEAYAERRKTLTRGDIEREFEALKLKVPRVYSLQISTENCTGDNIQNSQNCASCFDIIECQDDGYIEECKRLKDCFDITILEDSELCYEVSSSHIMNNCTFCFMCLSGSNLEFCELVMNSKDCFGCIGLNHKQYYILNQPYSKEAYVKKVAEIKEQLKREGRYGRWYFPETHPSQDTMGGWPRM